ncbi:MAG: conserved membrane protein of unknown function [Candidatus Thorarchaeota archaeon]|nr:MAG: conserved membrane protein of unknown function [Candidatus Thorarchaeota archaeon]
MPPVEPGPIRDFILALDAGAIFYSILYMSILLHRWYRDRLKKEQDIRFTWSLFFLGLLGNLLAFSFTRLTELSTFVEMLLIRGGYISLILAGTSFFAVLERVADFQSKNLFSKVFAASCSLALIIPLDYVGVLAFLMSTIALGGFVHYLYLSIKRSTGLVRRILIRIIFGIIVGFLAYLIRVEPLILLMGNILHILSGILLALSLILVGEAILDSPALDELDWQQHILELYVTHNSGSMLYSHSFTETDETRSALTAASISGAQSLFQEITSTESGFDTLSLGDKHLLFAHRENFTAVLLTQRPYGVLLDKLNEFADDFQLVYGPAIDNFRSRVTEFNSAYDLVEMVFLS